MNKFLNILRVILTILIGVTLFIASFTLPGITIVISCLICIFWIGTSIMELIRKQNFSLRHNIVSVIVLFMLGIIIYRPWIDSLFSANLGHYMLFNDIIVLFDQNKIWIIMVALCQFASNYIDYKSKV